MINEKLEFLYANLGKENYDYVEKLFIEMSDLIDNLTSNNEPKASNDVRKWLSRYNHINKCTIIEDMEIDRYLKSEMVYFYGEVDDDRYHIIITPILKKNILFIENGYDSQKTILFKEHCTAIYKDKNHAALATAMVVLTDTIFSDIVEKEYLPMCVVNTVFTKAMLAGIPKDILVIVFVLHSKYSQMALELAENENYLNEDEIEQLKELERRIGGI